jgi:DeoR family glycerol-3-phosphate regulon repressor
VVADHAKFGHSALVHAFECDAVDLLITDEAPAPALAQVFAAAEVEVSFGALASVAPVDDPADVTA